MILLRPSLPSIRLWSKFFYFSFLGIGKVAWCPALSPRTLRWGRRPFAAPTVLSSRHFQGSGAFNANGKETGSLSFGKSQVSPTQLNVRVSRVPAVTMSLRFSWAISLTHTAMQAASFQPSSFVNISKTFILLAHWPFPPWRPASIINSANLKLETSCFS